jgi:hypothetical protein
MVKTNPYRIDFAEMRRVSARLNYRRFWWLPLGTTVIGVGLTVMDRHVWPLAVLLPALGLAATYLRTLVTLNSVRKAPLLRRELPMEFDAHEMRQLEGEELSAPVRYADLVRFQEQREGLLLWLTSMQYVLVPRRAFATTGDLATAKHYIHQARGGLR